MGSKLNSNPCDFHLHAFRLLVSEFNLFYVIQLRFAKCGLDKLWVKCGLSQVDVRLLRDKEQNGLSLSFSTKHCDKTHQFCNFNC